MPERIDLSRSDDLRDVVHRAVACLSQGGVVGVPTETTYAVAAGALNPDALARVAGFKGADESRPLSICVRGCEEARDWAPGLGTVGRRFARRAWPGPVTLVVEGDLSRGLARRLPSRASAIIAPGGASIGLRSPAHDVLREVMRLFSGPVVLSGAHHRGSPPAVTAEQAASLGELDMILDDGPAPAREPPTVVRIDAGDGWRVERPGAVDSSRLTRMAGTIVLFVCTGNTCRSPMAEALCKTLIAERLGCPTHELEDRGYVVLSAGMGAVNGQPANPNAVEVVKSWGASLKEHASRRLTPELVDQADWIVVMTRDHQDGLLIHLPEAEPRTHLLHSEGDDVDDPIGSDRETYRQTADEIVRHLGRLLEKLGLG